MEKAVKIKVWQHMHIGNIIRGRRRPSHTVSFSGAASVRIPFSPLNPPTASSSSIEKGVNREERFGLTRDDFVKRRQIYLRSYKFRTRRSISHRIKIALKKLRAAVVGVLASKRYSAIASRGIRRIKRCVSDARWTE